jgi:Subtilisin inhibitor-like
MRVLAALLSVSASLHITVWPNGEPGAHRMWTLRCSPVGGTLPHRASACRRLSRLTHNPFAPTPSGVACSEIYGGPQTARVRGVFRRHRLDSHFNRHDGCEIARWARLRFLFAGAGGLPHQLVRKGQI